MSGARQAGSVSTPSSSSQLADRQASGVSPGVELAARELPQAGQRLAGGPLRDQDPAVGIDQRAGGDQRATSVTSGSRH